MRGAKAEGRGRLVEGWGGRGHRSDRMQASVQTLFQTPQEPFGVPVAQPVPFLTHTSSELDECKGPGTWGSPVRGGWPGFSKPHSAA